MASYLPGDAYYHQVSISNPTTGVAQNADSLPVATANHNGTDDGGFILTVTPLATGVYMISGTIPSGYAKGDVINIRVTATVNTVAGEGSIDTQVLDGKRVGDISLDSTGRINVGKVMDSATAATALMLQMGAQNVGTVSDTSPTTTSFKGVTSLSNADNQYDGQLLAFATGVLVGIPRKITGYTGATRLFTFATAFPFAPSNGDSFVILGYLP